MAEQHQHHITLDCSVCGAPHEAVGRMSDKSSYCFNCGSYGEFDITLTAHSHHPEVIEPADKE